MMPVSKKITDELAETHRLMREIINSMRLTVSGTHRTIDACRRSMAQADTVLNGEIRWFGKHQ